ncbi:methyltransferase [Streptosporangium sp. NPDC048047]|uniref:methyltransferase n=1 Tax=Streptosporangium sp. NPDC048047 TaxID=3155748 RepID=UPI003423C847
MTSLPPFPTRRVDDLGPKEGRSPAGPRDDVQRIIGTVWDFSALLVFDELNMIGHLADEPLTVDELAERCGAHSGALRRVLRTLEPYDLARLRWGERWALTAIGTFLHDDTGEAIRRYVRKRAEPHRWQEVPTWPEQVTEGRRVTPSSRRLRRGLGASASIRLSDLLDSVDDFGALFVAAQLGLADRLASTPMCIEELTTEYGADGKTLSWMLQRLISHGLFTRKGDLYATRPAGETLQQDRADSMRLAVLMNGQMLWWEMLRRLPDTVRLGAPTLPDGSSSTYAYLAAHPDILARFQAFMAARTYPVARWLAAEAAPGSTVVDVGGGHGTVLAEILQAQPTCRGVLLERPDVILAARDSLAGRGLLERCTLMAGDFFAEVPAGGDTYILGSVLHNWSDDHARRILKRVREAMMRTGGSRLWCIDALLPFNDEPHPGRSLDMRMLSLFGAGQERTRREYEALLADAGLTVRRQIRLPHALTMTEAVIAAR